MTLTEKMVKVHNDQSTITASFTIKKGQKILFSLGYSSQSPAIVPELLITRANRMTESIRFAQEKRENFSYSDIAEDKVQRRRVTLKHLSQTPSGAIVDAQTSSLQAESGGIRNC